METFAIETDGMGVFQVRATGPDDDLGHIVLNFRTWRQAPDWIDDQPQNHCSTDPVWL